MYSAAVFLCVVYRVTSGFTVMASHNLRKSARRCAAPVVRLGSLSSAKLLEFKQKGAVAHVTAPLLFVESKNKKHVFVKIKACATDFLENQKFSMDL